MFDDVRESRIEVPFVLGLNDVNLPPKRKRGRLQLFRIGHGVRIVRIDKDAYHKGFRCQLT